MSFLPSTGFPILGIAPSFEGFLSPTELLRTEGSIQFKLLSDGLKDRTEGAIVSIADEDFLFFIGFGNEIPGSPGQGFLMFARGDDVLRLPLQHLVQLYADLHIIVGWTRTTMLLSVWRFDSAKTTSTDRFPTESACITRLNSADGTEGFICECQTDPYAPPKTLLDWARRQGLVPVTQYDTEEAFYARFFHALGSLEQKLESVREPSCFWDITYEGNKIIARTPKRERDLHSIIESVLSDHLFLSSIEVCGCPFG